MKAIGVMFRTPRVGLRLTIIRQFAKFSIVGVVNTVTSFTVYVLMIQQAGLDPLLANVIAFIVAVTASFFLNKAWTFRDHGKVYVRQYTTFFVISGIGLGISTVILFILYTVLHIHYITSFLIAAAVVVFWNFTANRTWTFSHRRVA